MGSKDEIKYRLQELKDIFTIFRNGGLRFSTFLWQQSMTNAQYSFPNGFFQVIFLAFKIFVTWNLIQKHEDAEHDFIMGEEKTR